MTYVFLDTMIYLHFTWVEDIAFQTVVGSSDVHVVVPNITLHELDSHKDSHSLGSVRSRARKVLNRFLEMFMENTPPKGTLQFSAFDESVQFDFGAHNLDKAKNDHRLLAAILEFRETTSEDILLITQDKGLRLKAQRLKIKSLELTDTHRLPSQEDPVERENRKLRNDLQKLKSAMPKLSLGAFGGQGGVVSHVELAIRSPKTVVDIKVLMDQEDGKYPLRDKRPDRPYQNAMLEAVGQFSNIPQEEYDRYNKERAEYMDQFYEYLHELKGYHEQCRAELQLCLTNEGGKPAEDVDLHIHFPDGFSLYESEEVPREPEPPAPPRRPMGSMELLTQNMCTSPLYVPPSFRDYIPGVAEPPSNFSLRQTNSYELKDKFGRIKHGHIESIQKLTIIFDSYETAKSFQINYRMTAANLPQAIEGEFNITIEKTSDDKN